MHCIWTTFLYFPPISIRLSYSNFKSNANKRRTLHGISKNKNKKKILRNKIAIASKYSNCVKASG